MVTGYALVDSANVAFSWHLTREDALSRLQYEKQVFGRSLRLIMAQQAIWTEVESIGVKDTTLPEYALFALDEHDARRVPKSRATGHVMYPGNGLPDRHEQIGIVVMCTHGSLIKPWTDCSRWQISALGVRW